MSEKIVYQAAELRGQGKFQDAIDIVEKNRKILNKDSYSLALREAFQAAEEGGFTDKAKQLAEEIAQQDPGLPSIQGYI